jgi:hypothetical protein
VICLNRLAKLVFWAGDFGGEWPDIVCTVRGYRDVDLSFAQAFPVRESFMVPAIAPVRDYRRQGIGFELSQPENLSAIETFFTTPVGSI